MSRSNPTSSNPNPSTRWLSWHGKEGVLSWYNKESKENVIVDDGFRFLVLDQLSTVTGYSKKKEDGITSNEVRDVRADALLVRYFKGGDIANGLWAQIKEKVAFCSGKFATSVYIAFKDDDGTLQIGNIKMSGCALGPWIDFVKQNRKALNEKAVTIRAGKQDTSGSVDFIPPVFSLVETSPATNEAAIALDRELQDFLTGYLNRPTIDKAKEREDQPMDETPPPRGRRAPDPDLDVEEDDIPFS